MLEELPFKLFVVDDEVDRVDEEVVVVVADEEVEEEDDEAVDDDDSDAVDAAELVEDDKEVERIEVRGGCEFVRELWFQF